jgi:hypothetical protein
VTDTPTPPPPPLAPTSAAAAELATAVEELADGVQVVATRLSALSRDELLNVTVHAVLALAAARRGPLLRELADWVSLDESWQLPVADERRRWPT